MTEQCPNCRRREHRLCSRPSEVLTTQEVMKMVSDSIPNEAKITKIHYEGPRIAIYSQNPTFLRKNSFYVSEIVAKLKKHVVVRTGKESDTQEVIETKRFECCCGEETWIA